MLYKPIKFNDSTGTEGSPEQPPRSVINRLWFVIGYVWAVLMTAFFAFTYGLGHLVTRDPAVFQYWASRWGASLLFGFGVRADAEFRAVLDPRRSYVFVANHQNLLDIPLLARILPCPFGFVAKAELEEVPFLGMALRISPSVFVEGRDPRRSLESIQRAGKQIREGCSVIIFPEGQRTFSDTMMPFKRSAFRLAAEARVPIVPITIVDSFRLMNEDRMTSRPGRVRVVVHEPVEVEGQSRGELGPLIDTVRSIIESALPAGEPV